MTRIHAKLSPAFGLAKSLRIISDSKGSSDQFRNTLNWLCGFGDGPLLDLIECVGKRPVKLLGVVIVSEENFFVGIQFQLFVQVDLGSHPFVVKVLTRVRLAGHNNILGGAI